MNANSVTHFSSFHKAKNSFLEPQYDLLATFTEKTLEHERMQMLGRVAVITVASAGFGLAMGVFMGSFEYNMTMGIDNNRSGWSQLRQHYFGYWRFLKRQSLHFSRFGLYIGLIDIPLEILVGRQNFMTMGASAGLAAWFQNVRAPFLPTFLGSGAFVGCIGLFMNRGDD